MSFGSASTRSSSGSTPAPVSRAGRQEINHHVAVYRYAPLPPTSSQRRLLRSPFYSPPLVCHRRILCGVRAGEERRRWTAFFTFENLVNHVHGAVASTVSGLVAHLAYERPCLRLGDRGSPVHGLRRAGHLCGAARTSGVPG